MKKTLPRNWSYLFTFTLICASAFAMLIFRPESYLRSTPPELTPGRETPAAELMNTVNRGTRTQESPAVGASIPAKVKILLMIGDEKTIGKSKIIYRGLSGDSEFKIDVVIPELDPHAKYGYRLSIDKAQKGFRLAGHRFKLITARKNAIQIWHFRR